MATHEQLIEGVLSTACQLMERDHFASDEIEARTVHLQEAWDELQTLSDARHKRLQSSLTAQQVKRQKSVPYIQGSHRNMATKFRDF